MELEVLAITICIIGWGQVRIVRFCHEYGQTLKTVTFRGARPTGADLVAAR